MSYYITQYNKKGKVTTVSTVLYTKHGSRYKLATLGEQVAGLSATLSDAGYHNLSADLVEQIISALDHTRVSSDDVKLITGHVITQLQKHGE